MAQDRTPQPTTKMIDGRVRAVHHQPRKGPRTVTRAAFFLSFAAASLGVLAPAALRAEPSATGAEEPPPRSEYRLYADPDLGSTAGIVNVATGARLWLGAVGEGLSLVPHGAEPSPFGALERLGTFALLELPAVNYEIVLSHEVFGHGARIHELGGTPKYNLDLPLPYSLDAEFQADKSGFSRSLSADEHDLIGLGGLQAQEALQRHLAFTAFRAGVLRRGEAVLYTSNALTHMAQVFVGNDIRQHITYLERRFDAVSDDERLRVDAALAFDAIDPLLLYSVYVAGYRYLLRGDRVAPYPFVPLGDWRLSATSRTMVVPWGVEHQLDVLLGAPWANMDLTLRTGGGPGGGSVGLEAALQDLKLLPVLHLGAMVSLWSQPGLQIEGEGDRIDVAYPFPTSIAPPPRYEVPDQLYGMGGSLLLEFHQPSYFIGTQLNAKSAGLVVERPIAAGADVLLTGGVKL